MNVLDNTGKWVIPLFVGCFPPFLDSYNKQLKPPLFLIPLLPLFPVRETSGNNGLKAKTPHKSVRVFFACREDQRTTEIFRKAIKMWNEGGGMLRWAGTVPSSSWWACIFPSGRDVPFLSARLVRSQTDGYLCMSLMRYNLLQMLTSHV